MVLCQPLAVLSHCLWAPLREGPKRLFGGVDDVAISSLETRLPLKNRAASGELMTLLADAMNHLPPVENPSDEVFGWDTLAAGPFGYLIDL